MEHPPLVTQLQWAQAADDGALAPHTVSFYRERVRPQNSTFCLGHGAVARPTARNPPSNSTFNANPAKVPLTKHLFFRLSSEQSGIVCACKA
jgi:hypothetical protein